MNTGTGRAKMYSGVMDTTTVSGLGNTGVFMRKSKEDQQVKVQPTYNSHTITSQTNLNRVNPPPPANYLTLATERFTTQPCKR